MNYYTLNFIANLNDAAEAAEQVQNGIDVTINERFTEVLVRKNCSYLLDNKVDKKTVLNELKEVKTDNNYLKTLINIQINSIESDFKIEALKRKVGNKIYHLTPEQREIEIQRVRDNM